MRLPPWPFAGTFALLGLTGCPLTDDYFIDAGQAGQTAAAAASGSGGVVAQGGEAPAGGTCLPRTERCNGYDDNCNNVVDEVACDGAPGCTGFTLSLDRQHGYMFCSGHNNWAQAQSACAVQDMRLVSFETSAEGGELAQALADLTTDDTWLGANDQAVEGEWVWAGGAQFWQGNQTGSSVAGAFVAWANGSPDNSGNGEDCAIINPNTKAWADRSCVGEHAYVCEDATP